MSERARTCCAPPGPVQSPGSTIRSSMSTPSEVVRRRVARRAQDVGDQPGHGGLAVGPGDRDDRDAPLRVADPGRRSRPGRRDPLAPARPEPLLARRSAAAVRDGEMSRSARAMAASVRTRARSSAGPRERDDPVARVGRAMDRQARIGPRRGPRAAGGPSRRSRRSDRATRAPAPSRRARPGRGGRDRAGRTTSAVGRSRPPP